MALQTLWWQHHKETMNSLVLEFPYFPVFFFENCLSKSCAVVRVIANFGHCHDLCLRQTNVCVAVDTSADIGIVAVDSMCKCNFKNLQKTCVKLIVKNWLQNRLLRSSSQIVFTDRLQKLSHGSSSTFVFKYCGLSGDLSFGHHYQTVTYSGQRSQTVTSWPYLCISWSWGPIELSVKPTDGKVLRKSRIRTNPIGTHRIKTD